MKLGGADAPTTQRSQVGQISGPKEVAKLVEKRGLLGIAIIAEGAPQIIQVSVRKKSQNTAKTLEVPDDTEVTRSRFRPKTFPQVLLERGGKGGRENDRADSSKIRSRETEGGA